MARRAPKRPTLRLPVGLREAKRRYRYLGSAYPYSEAWRVRQTAVRLSVDYAVPFFRAVRIVKLLAKQQLNPPKRNTE